MKYLWMLAFAGMTAFLLSPVNAASEWSGQNALKEIGFDQKMGAQISKDLTFRDETGRPVRLAEYLNGKPAVLNLVYYRCPMLCTEVLNGLLRALRALTFTVGEEFNVITISIDPRETSTLADKKSAVYRQGYNRPVR